MTRPTEPLFPSHPPHVIHHEPCGHILRRVLVPIPGDASRTGCMCDMPPEPKWETHRFERGGVQCEIDELTYEARSVKIECNACLEARTAGPASRDEENNVKQTAKVTLKCNKVVKRTPKSVRKRASPSPKVKGTPMTKLAREIEGLGIEPSTPTPSKRKRRSTRQANQSENETEKIMDEDTEMIDIETGFEEGSIEDRVWKALRSRDIFPG
ncbi:hypothetical protein ABW19_dt0210643 [Dactylella cylindrospora]|nr:hypothetical protein ABW19_dt0210643 [Dactylella cylindrospora]